MRPLAAFVLGFVLLLCGSQIAAAGPGVAPDSIVYPTGVAATDRANVQAAVNAGGMVLLKATDAAGDPTAFEFGRGRVLLNQDVSILGESIDGVMTVVRHGFQPFQSRFGVPVRAAIRGIHFEGPLSAAVVLNWSRGFEFTGNVVTDVIGTPAFGLTKGQAVLVTQGTIGHAVTGHITIANNIVERVHADLSYGVALAIFDASADISGNVFRDTKDTGVLVVGGSQAISIQDNLVLGGAPEAGFSSTGNGIVTGLGAGPLYIAGNTVVCDNPFADGIAIEGVIDSSSGLGVPANEIPASSVVEHNHVTMDGSQYGGISIYGELQPSLVANNRVDGDAAYALDIVPFAGDETTEGTVFRGNNISGLQASVADVFLDYVARDTVLVGNSGTVIDNGVNNRIAGFTSLAGGVGPELRAAQQRKHQQLQTVQAATQPDPE